MTLLQRSLVLGVLALAFACNKKSHNLPAPENIDFERRVELGIICSATLEIEGRFEQEAQPSDINGCWPVGTWTLTPTATHSDCNSHDILLEEYQFRVTRDEQENESYAYLTDPTDENVSIKVSSGGSGECEGNVLQLSRDGLQRVNLTVSQDDSELNGHGEYEQYEEDQR
jgi:hypothetical protein